MQKTLQAILTANPEYITYKERLTAAHAIAKDVLKNEHTTEATLAVFDQLRDLMYQEVSNDLKPQKEVTH